jgi:aminopeptidase N
VRHLFSRARELIPAQGADLSFLYANANESGFYRPLHAPDLLEDLIAGVESLRPIERQGLIDHQWALVRSGHASLAGMLDLAARLGDDDDPDVLAAVSVPLASLCKRLAPDVAPEAEARLRAWVEVYFGGQVDELGWGPLPDEDDRTRLRRAEILRIVGVIGEASEVLEEATVRCLRYLDDRASLPPNLADVVVALAAMCGGPSIYDAFQIAMRRATTPQEQKRFLLALADFGQPELTDRTLALCVNDEVGMQDVAFVLIRLLENRHARERTWSFIRRRWSTLRRHLPPVLGNRLIAATPALLTPRHRREVADFFRAHPLPASERAVKQALERFDWYAGFRKRVGPELVAYLSGPER